MKSRRKRLLQCGGRHGGSDVQRLEGPLHRIPHYTPVTAAQWCPCEGGCSPLGGFAKEGGLVSSRFFSQCSLSRQCMAPVNSSIPAKPHLEFAQWNEAGLHVFDLQVTLLNLCATCCHNGDGFPRGRHGGLSVFSQFTVDEFCWNATTIVTHIYVHPQTHTYTQITPDVTF